LGLLKSRWTASIMLKQRVITGIILVPVVVAALLYLPTIWLAALFGVIAAAGAWEWASLVHTKFVSKVAYVSICSLLIISSWYLLEESHIRLFMLIASCYWVFILFLLSFYQSSWLGDPILQSCLQYSGYLIIAAGWMAIVTLHQQKPTLLLFLFVLIWVVDTAAYFAGKRFGRVKLAEQLSPGKTREGLWGALCATFLLSLIGAWWFGLEPGGAVYFIILCMLSALISVVGDLFESLLKRNAGTKDSGFLIPGHGGVLDRIDSMLAASPGFVLGLYWLN